MKRDDVDRWLSEDDSIVPSSGFVESVMDAVRREAIEQGALPFPWKRALPGFIALVVTLVGLLAFGIRAAADGTAARGPAASALLDLAMNPAVVWIAVTLALTVMPLIWVVRTIRAYR